MNDLEAIVGVAGKETGIIGIKIESLEDLPLAIARHPGAEIVGLGQLPKVKPLEKPIAAERPYESSPQPGHVESALKWNEKFKYPAG